MEKQKDGTTSFEFNYQIFLNLIPIFTRYFKQTKVKQKKFPYRNFFILRA